MTKAKSHQAKPTMVRDRPLTFEEFITEIRWLMSFGMTPDNINKELGYKRGSLMRRIDRHKDRALHRDIIDYYINYAKEETNGQHVPPGHR